MQCSANTKTTNVRKLVSTALLGAAATVLMFLEFPIPVIVPGFLKFDFSDFPALIAAFAYGPLSGILVCAIKNVIHLTTSGTAGIGELANFIMGAFYVLPAGFIYKHYQTKKSAVLSALAGAALMAVMSVPVNYFIVYPLYSSVLGFTTPAVVGMYSVILPAADTLLKALVIFNFPFTLVKGLAGMGITLAVYKKLSPILKGKCAENNNVL